MHGKTALFDYISENHIFNNGWSQEQERLALSVRTNFRAVILFHLISSPIFVDFIHIFADLCCAKISKLKVSDP